MMGLSTWHLAIFALVAVLLFGGGGKISSIMGDIGKGFKSLRKGLTDEDDINIDDPDCPPLTAEQLKQLKPVSKEKRERLQMGLSEEGMRKHLKAERK